MEAQTLPRPVFLAAETGKTRAGRARVRRQNRLVFQTELLVEAADASASIHHLLLAGEEGVTLGAKLRLGCPFWWILSQSRCHRHTGLWSACRWDGCLPSYVFTSFCCQKNRRSASACYMLPLSLEKASLFSRFFHLFPAHGKEMPCPREREPEDPPGHRLARHRCQGIGIGRHLPLVMLASVLHSLLGGNPVGLKVHDGNARLGLKPTVHHAPAGGPPPRRRLGERTSLPGPERRRDTPGGGSPPPTLPGLHRWQKVGHRLGDPPSGPGQVRKACWVRRASSSATAAAEPVRSRRMLCITVCTAVPRWAGVRPRCPGQTGAAGRGPAPPKDLAGERRQALPAWAATCGGDFGRGGRGRRVGVVPEELAEKFRPGHGFPVPCSDGAGCRAASWDTAPWW